MFNPHINFDMSTITCNEEMKGNAKCTNFRFEPPFGRLRGNEHGSSMARWKAKDLDVLINDSLTPQSHINIISATANPNSGIGFYDFFQSVAVNSVYKVTNRIFTIIFAVLLPVLSKQLILSINTIFFDFSRWRPSALLDF